MKKLLILALLPLVTLTAYCQDSTKVANSTLVNFKRFADKCDSLQVRYQEKSVLLDSTIVNYFALLNKMEARNAKNIELAAQLEKVNDDLLKVSKNPFGNLTAFLTGGVCGIVLALLLVLL